MLFIRIVIHYSVIAGLLSVPEREVSRHSQDHPVSENVRACGFRPGEGGLLPPEPDVGTGPHGCGGCQDAGVRYSGSFVRGDGHGERVAGEDVGISIRAGGMVSAKLAATRPAERKPAEVGKGHLFNTTIYGFFRPGMADVRVGGAGKFSGFCSGTPSWAGRPGPLRTAFFSA